MKSTRWEKPTDQAPISHRGAGCIMKKAFFSASSQPFFKRLGSQTVPGAPPGEKRRSVSAEISFNFRTSGPVSFEMRLFLVAGLLLTWISVGGAAQRAKTNPHTSPEDVAAGGRIYRSHCVECHGRDGTGGRGPDITRGDLRYGNSDAALADTISTGIPGTSMPLFFFNGKQLWQIVAFVQSLRREEPRPPGDSTAGAALFRGKGSCVNCHMVDGQGGRQGPDLTTVGARRSLPHLRSAILEPNQWVSPRDWKIQAKTKSGAPVAGVRLNEDTHSLQLLDSNDKLLSLVKKDLASYQVVKESAMPSYAGQLSQGELDDLVAYLYTLRGKGASP